MSARPTQAADRFVVVDGTRLRFRDEGRGPAVLLVHGWTLDLEMWNPQVTALRDTFRLIRLDRRGHGLSGGLPAPQLDGEDLAALCRHLGLARVAVLGMSQGARAVLGFAATRPEQVAAVILDGPPPLDGEADTDLPLERYVALVRAHGIDAFRHEWARGALMQLRTQHAEAHSLLAAMIARYPGNDLRCPPSPAGGIGVDSITAPTLILSGAHDLASRRHAARQLAARLTDAELVVVPGAGHLPNLDRPDVYSTFCRAFLTRHCPRATY
ncbi:MAG TPA: alpha/beta fold hydrolase [Steroidobacteraceae bacterium]|nr:alpha/beta fold hydrolase [Steroidobacteraceae bacterium]